MKIILEPAECEQFFYDSLCNGLYELQCYGIAVKTTEKAYTSAKKRLKKAKPNEVICYEDVLMEILRGGDVLKFVDEEGFEDPIEVTLAMVHERMNDVPLKWIMQKIERNDDAITADVILQTIAFGEIVYG